MNEPSTITFHITIVMALGSLTFCFENAFVFSPRLKQPTVGSILAFQLSFLRSNKPSGKDRSMNSPVYEMLKDISSVVILLLL